MLEGLKRILSRNSGERQALVLTDPNGWSTGQPFDGASQSVSMKLSTVNAAVEIRSDSIGKLPFFVMEGRTKDHIPDHYLVPLLTERPNELMTPFILKKMAEIHRLQWGNAFWLIARDGYSARPREIIPLHPANVHPYVDEDGKLWYIATNPRTGERRKLRSWDLVHFKGYSEDGITGKSVLSRASETISTALEQLRYESKLYRQSARPSGVLSVEADLGEDAKNEVRKEWDKIHAGADNAFRIAVLDNGFKYAQIGLSNRDAQFIESKAVTVEDISRYYGVPLYKLQAGKQSYESNEHNSIEYVVNTLHPVVTQMEQETTYKMLFDYELKKGIEARMNMNAEMRGDMSTRALWYKSMREIGAYSVNDIRALEDAPPADGGDERLASLNYVPLDMFRVLSEQRNRSEEGG